ncbi:MAG: 5'-nucleotidase C-terminal domain-containing protein [Alistipes sp.]|jgi:2',3'-cyclic-nucleotide 2'-phosphodiesterase (5'-nucleotidase family)|nr:5'-nucleotidase C-terminal domain-containing protein [Alistipes sp.]
MNKRVLIIVLCLLTVTLHFGAHAQGGRRDTITILSYNDFHGAFISGADAAGADNFIAALMAAKEGAPNPIILSGGDNFSGSYYSLMSRGEPHQVFTLPISSGRVISAVGNHEFDWGGDYLLGTSCEYIDYVGANVTAKRDKKAFKRAVPDYRIVESGALRIGVIGLTTPTTPFSGKQSYVRDFSFDAEFSSSVNRIARSLKAKDDVDLVILLMHIGTSMDGGTPSIDDSDKESERELRRIAGVDAIVSAHSHKLVRGDFAIANGTDRVPMIQAGNNGTHIGMMQFELYDEQVRCIKNSLIAVPVPNPQIKQLVDSISNASGFNEPVVRVTRELIHDRNINLHEFTDVGAIVTASYVREYEQSMGRSTVPIIAVNHFKGIRTGISEGELSKAQVGNVLPFGGNLVAYKMTGAEIRRLFADGMDDSQSRGRLQTCNISFVMSGEEIVSVKWFDGVDFVEIADTTECVLLCDDFIAYGGDGYDADLFKNNRIEDFDIRITTDCLIKYLREYREFPNDSYKIPNIDRIGE